jgi:hypothetical protein
MLLRLDIKPPPEAEGTQSPVEISVDCFMCTDDGCASTLLIQSLLLTNEQSEQKHDTVCNECIVIMQVSLFVYLLMV